ncbi:MAG: tRNA (guanosine(37)-N1)-methyltransferase TrmD [Oscillospiraceae bacterium]|nr:tRNA (guanosine(37)-N1)-methyltransferase TrmD [Oscillospiraceae bacterium]
MRIDIATLFPEMCERVLDESIIGRARKAGKITVNCHNIREWSTDKHRRVDDTTYGGGMGMLMQAEPIYRCFLDITKDMAEKPHTIYMSPKGKLFTQQKAKEFITKENIFIICGHYEGVDQRIIDKIVDEEISVGDYVLTGGELPALIVTDAVSRLCEGVLSANVCFEDESHYKGLLEYPQYTKPEEWEGMKVPPVLLSGHHKNIDDWRMQKSLEITQKNRPDMYERYILEKEKKG